MRKLKLYFWSTQLLVNRKKNNNKYERNEVEEETNRQLIIIFKRWAFQVKEIKRQMSVDLEICV